MALVIHCPVTNSKNKKNCKSRSSVFVLPTLFSEGYDFNTFKKLQSHHLRELIPTTKERIILEIKLNELVSSGECAAINDVEIVCRQESPVAHHYIVLEDDVSDLDASIGNESSSQPFVSSPTSGAALRSESFPTHPKISESPVLKDMCDLDMEVAYARFAKNGSLEATDRGKISRCIIKFLLQKSTTKVLVKNISFVSAIQNFERLFS